MKTAASIFSWLGGIATTILVFVNLSKGVEVVTTYYNPYYGYYNQVSNQPYPSYVWILAVIFAIVRLIILIWRQSATNNGKKIACGVCTLLFASLLGGIFTLCIPEDQLY